MERTPADLSTDFLFPKLHGMWARAIKGDALDRLVHSAGLEAMARQVAPLGLDVTRRGDFQRELTAAHIEELAGIKWLLDQRTADFYEALIRRYFYENLKTVVHYYFTPAQDVPIRVLLIESDELPSFDAGGLLEARNVNQLYSRLPDAAQRSDILRLLVETEDSRDLLAADCRLDRMFYADLLESVHRMPWAYRGSARELVCMEIDFSNLTTILRNAAIYQLPPDTVLELCLEGGQVLDSGHLRRLVDVSDERALLQALPPQYRRLLAPYTDAELYLAENALWNAHYRLALDRFSDFNRPSSSVVAFPFLKRYEMLNISRVFEGLHFGLDVRLMQSMMIGGEHV